MRKLRIRSSPRAAGSEPGPVLLFFPTAQNKQRASDKNSSAGLKLISFPTHVPFLSFPPRFRFPDAAPSSPSLGTPAGASGRPPALRRGRLTASGRLPPQGSCLSLPCSLLSGLTPSPRAFSYSRGPSGPSLPLRSPAPRAGTPSVFHCCLLRTQLRAGLLAASPAGRPELLPRPPSTTTAAQVTLSLGGLSSEAEGCWRAHTTYLPIPPAHKGRPHASFIFLPSEWSLGRMHRM